MSIRNVDDDPRAMPPTPLSAYVLGFADITLGDLARVGDSISLNPDVAISTAIRVPEVEAGAKSGAAG